MSFGKNLITHSPFVDLSKLQHRDISQLVSISQERIVPGMKIGLDDAEQVITVEYGNGTKVTRTRNADGVLNIVVLNRGTYLMNCGGTFWWPID